MHSNTELALEKEGRSIVPDASQEAVTRPGHGINLDAIPGGIDFCILDFGYTSL